MASVLLGGPPGSQLDYVLLVNSARKVALLGYATACSGANRALGRIYDILRSESETADLGTEFIAVTSRLGQGSHLAQPSVRRNFRTKSQLFRLFSRKLRKHFFRLLGGESLYSRGGVATGLVSEARNAYPDIIVSNWFGDYTDSVEELGQVTQPLILRNGDVWWFQGSRHFAPLPGAPVSSWQPFMERMFFGREDSKTLQRKKEHLYPRVSATVSPSPWMTSQVVDSGLMPHATHVTIPNPLNTDTWFPEDREKARESLGLNPAEFSIGFGAIGGTKDPRKGADLLLQSLHILREFYQGVTPIRCDVFGEDGRPQSRAGFPVYRHGRLGDEQLRRFYSAVDVFVVPSRMEGFPNTAIEALACRTPVIAFDTGPMGDYLTHRAKRLLCEVIEGGKGPEVIERFNRFCEGDFD